MDFANSRTYERFLPDGGGDIQAETINRLNQMSHLWLILNLIHISLQNMLIK